MWKTSPSEYCFQLTNWKTDSRWSISQYSIDPLSGLGSKKKMKNKTAICNSFQI
ncbi:hypothetical protein HanRHA438_Chr04g0180281 [Helianthus annuus]|nr:hypothetical protein HanRHA438_Chr04g0180281 [Helianthus annuus]